MTQRDMTCILSYIKTLYPNFYRDQSGDELSSVVKTWTELFANSEPGAVKAAVMEYASSDTVGRPPWPGVIKAIVRRNTPEKRFVQTGIDDAGCPTGHWEDVQC